MRSVKDIERSVKNLTVESGERIHDRILDKLLTKVDESGRQAAGKRSSIPRMIVIGKVGRIAAALLIVSSLSACYVLSKKVADLKNDLAQARREIAIAQQNTTLTRPDDTTTINLYLQEHRDLIARHASFSPTPPQPAQMHVSRHDVLYFEFFDDGPEYMQPGIIVRGPLSGGEIDSSKTPVISNGRTLTLSDARQSAGFELRAPARLHPGYCLDQIRTIDGRESLQLLYTDGIDSISLFEQSLDGQRGLEAKDLREYAVYRNAEQPAGTILAWRDNELSYVLIGNTEMSQLMDMAQSISAGE